MRIAFATIPQAEKIIDDDHKSWQRYHKYWQRYIDRVFPLLWIDKENGVAIFSLMFNAVSGRGSGIVSMR